MDVTIEIKDHYTESKVELENIEQDDEYILITLTFHNQDIFMTAKVSIEELKHAIRKLSAR
jgi:hypothetical protein